MASLFQNPLPGVPSVESPFFEALFPVATTDPEMLRIAQSPIATALPCWTFPIPKFWRGRTGSSRP